MYENAKPTKTTLIHEIGVELTAAIQARTPSQVYIHIHDAVHKLAQLSVELEKVGAERDAAIAEIKKERGCFSCKLADKCAEAFYHDDCTAWQWRGLEESTCG